MILIAHHQAPVAVEPGEQAFDLPSASETTQAAPVLGFCSLASAPMRGNEFNAPIVPEALVQGITVIGPISDQALGECLGEAGVEGVLDAADLMGLSTWRVHGERVPGRSAMAMSLLPLPRLVLPMPRPPF